MPQDQGYTLEQQRALALSRARRRRQQSGGDQEATRARVQNTVMSDVIDQQPVARAVRAGAQAFNLSDEFAGLSTRAGNLFRSEENRIDPQEAVRAERERVATRRQERPVSTFAEEMVGGGIVTAPLVGLGAGVRGAMASRPLLTAAGGAAAAGAVAGAGEGETPQERAVGGAVGGGIGALLGPATVVALGLGRNAAQGIARRVTGRGGAQAGDEVADAVNPAAVRFMNRTGLADDIRSNPEALSAGQDGDFLAERLGARGRTAAIGLAGASDQSQDVAETAIGARMAGRGERVANAARAATELPPVDADGVIRPEVTALMQLDEVRAAARPLFNAADSVEGRLSPRMREIFRSLDRAGVSFRNADELAARSGEARVGLSAFTDDLDNLPERVRLGDVRAMARAAENEARRLNRAGEDAGELWNMARELRDQIGRQSPEYREAARLWRSQARDEEAFDLGTRVLGGGRNNARLEREINRFVNGTSGPDAASPATQSERRAFLAGLSDAITTLTDTTLPTGNPATRISNERIRRRIRMVLGDDAADELLARVDLESGQARFETVANREVQSATEPRLAGREMVERGRAGGAQNAFAELISDPVEFIRFRRGRRQVADLIRSGDDAALAQVARVLFSQEDMADDPLVRAIMREAERRGIGVNAAPAVAASGQNLLLEGSRR